MIRLGASHVRRYHAPSSELLIIQSLSETLDSESVILRLMR